MRLHGLVCVAACGGMSPVSADSSPTRPSAGVEGLSGPAGPTGGPGAAGAPGPLSFHWVDALGTDVTVGPELTWIDPTTEHVWAIDPETGAFEPAVAGVVSTFYLAPYCTGTEFVELVEPHVPFEYWWGGTYHVRPRDVPSVDLCPATKVVANLCVSHVCLGDESFVATSLLTEIGPAIPPISPYVGPLHLEGR